MSYEYIETANADNLFSIGTSIAIELRDAGAPVYIVPDRKNAYWIHEWVWYMAYDLGRFIYKDGGDIASSEVAFIYKGKDLKEKWSSIITLDPDYLLTADEDPSIPRCRALMDELKLAGYEVK